MTDNGTTKSGWCFAPEGAKAFHENCPRGPEKNLVARFGITPCTCECHTKRTDQDDRLHR